MSLIKLVESKKYVFLFASFIFFSMVSSANATVKNVPNKALEVAQAYVPGEILIKFKDQAIVGDVADQLAQENVSTFADVTGDDHLDRLNRKHKVRGFKRVFNDDQTQKTQLRALKRNSKGRITKAHAEEIHRQAKLKHGERNKTIRARKSALVEQRGKRKDPLPREQKQVPYIDNVYKVQMDIGQDVKQACAEYLKDPNVEICQPNYKVKVSWVPNDRYYSRKGSWGQTYDDLWGLKKIEAAGAWDISKGAGTVVAVVDTGVDYTHPDIAANIWRNAGEIANNGIDDDRNGFIDDTRGWDFSSGDNDPKDDHGHGTHCAGTIAAVGNNSIGIIGVAPEAKIMPLKGLSSEGEGSSETLSNGIRYAAENGADVISNSWGAGPNYVDRVAELAIEYAYNLGAVVVFSAGNENSDVIAFAPANNSTKVITVAASSELDKKVDFSNFGSLIDVAAPGGGSVADQGQYNILSLLARNSGYSESLTDFIVGTDYLRIAGTSMACPHVAGVAALILSKNPEFTPDDVSQVIRASADDIESPGFDLQSGAGRVNARKALLMSSVPRVQILSPNSPIDADVVKTVAITGSAYGQGFVKYRLYYALYEKNFSDPNYNYAIGSWRALGPEMFQSVNNGVLGSFDSSLFLNEYYLLKLEVTTADGKTYSDVREIISYKNNPWVVPIAPVDLRTDAGLYRRPRRPAPSLKSAGDTFVWIQNEIIPKQPRYPNFTGVPAIAGVLKVYHGASNKLFSIYSSNWNTYYEREIYFIGVHDVFISPNYVVWYEFDNCTADPTHYYDCDRIIKIASISATGSPTVLREKRYVGRSESSDKGVIADLNQDRVFIIKNNTSSVIHTISTNSDVVVPFGAQNYRLFSLSGNSLAVLKDTRTDDSLRIQLYDLSTKLTTTIKTISSNGSIAVSGLKNFPAFLVWIESRDDGITYFMVYNKETKVIREQILGIFPDFDVNDKQVVYRDGGYLRGAKLLSSLLSTGRITKFVENFTPDLFYSKIHAGLQHIGWLETRNFFPSEPHRWVTFNDPPVIDALNNQTILLNQPYSLTIKAVDPQSDKINLKAVGGVWPDQAGTLPAGAAFTDNGNGTGTFRWTPSAGGIYTVSFLARDFSGRKDATWNTVKTVAFTTAPTCPAFNPTVTVSPQSGEIPLDAKFTVTISPICGNLTYQAGIDYGDGGFEILTPVKGGTISFSHRYGRYGNFTAKITVQNSRGEQVVISKPISAKAPVSWRASAQASGNRGWETIGGWDNCSHRTLIKGSLITKSGTKMRLRFKGVHAYQVKKVSVVERDSSTLNGVDATFKRVTFGGGTWEAGGMVPAGGSLYSDWIPFNVVPGKDIFVTLWSPSGNQMIPYLGDTTQATHWMTDSGDDKTSVIDWGSIYVPMSSWIVGGVEIMEVLE